MAQADALRVDGRIVRLARDAKRPVSWRGGLHKLVGDLDRSSGGEPTVNLAAAVSDLIAPLRCVRLVVDDIDGLS